MDCKDKPYELKTVLKNVTEARRKNKGGQPDEEDRDGKRKNDNYDRSERQSKRASGTSGTGGKTSCFAQTTSELVNAGNLELTEALGEGVSGIVYRGK